MAHLLYQTEGLVLAATDTGEANRMITLFTRDFGRISAHAQGVRWLKSKLRYSIQPLSRTAVTLVRGKEMWKIINAQASLFDCSAISLAAKSCLASLAQLINRLVHGEERHLALFAEVEAAMEFMIAEATHFPKDSIMTIAAIRVLSLLGYVAVDHIRPHQDILLLPWGRELMERGMAVEGLLNQVVAASFLHSQL